MAMIKGITVVLYEKTEVEKDPLGYPVYEESPIQVENVLVAPASSDDIPESLHLQGKKVIYTLAIPKGDEHDWEDKRIDFWGQSFRSVGFVTQGIEENIPLCWNKKVSVERYG